MKSHAVVISALLSIYLIFLIGMSAGNMGYNIHASVGNIGWSIDRFTNNLSYYFDESIYGKGNFSRYSSLNAISDVSYIERSSVVRNGSISLNEIEASKSMEGPVSISYGMQSVINNDDGENNSEYEKVYIVESWPYYFISQKNIKYEGRGIKTFDKYESSGDVISSYSDSWKLNKESTFSTINNRTRIFVNLTPQGLIRERDSNKKLKYALDVQSIGSKEALDVIKTVPSDERTQIDPKNIIARITQEYIGQVDMKLKIGSNEAFFGDLDPINNSSANDSSLDYIPCCQEGTLIDSQSILNSLGPCNYACMGTAVVTK